MKDLGPSKGATWQSEIGKRDTAKHSRHGQTWEVLSVLRAEVLARQPEAAVPSVEAVLAADAAGGLDTPLALEALASLQAASASAGLAFPPSLTR